MIDPSREKKPEAAEVHAFHENADKDGSQTALHHSLGPGPNQAAPGNHLHDGGSSKILDPVLSGTTITGAKTGNPAPALASVIAALVKLGATDSTTA